MQKHASLQNAAETVIEFHSLLAEQRSALHERKANQDGGVICCF